MPTLFRLRPALLLAALLRPAAALPVPDPAPAPPPAVVQGADAVSQGFQAPFLPVDLRHLDGLRRDLTLRFITQLGDPALRELTASRLGPGPAKVPLPALVDDWARLWPAPGRRAFADRIRDLDRDLRERLGIAGTSTSVLALELLRPDQGDGPLAWDRVLFALRPTGGTPPETVEAYDLQGRAVRLDPRLPPAVPVLLAGMDRREATRAGVELINRGLREAGLAGPPARSAPAAPVACLKLASVRVGQGFESWWGSGLEPYVLASGIDPAEAKPVIRLIHLPYLRHGERDYRPDQVLLFWNDYRFAAANLQFWNHEDGTAYKELLDAIIKGATAVLAVAGMPQFALIPAIADAILQAMPASWWAGSDTLMDTFYTLEKGVAYEDRTGAMGHVRATLAPWVLRPQ